MNKDNKNIVILGAGESGIGCAILAKKKKFKVFISDIGKIHPKYISTLNEYQIEYEQEKHTEEIILQADEIIISPGIPLNTPVIQKAKERQISIISELDFAQRYTSAKIIAITGTNGKSTTSSWIYHTFKLANYNACLAGNIGNSFAREVALHQYDWYILEVSSFQLDTSHTFHPHIAIITNIAQNHLNRYDYSMEKYIESKFKITQNQTQSDYLIYNADDKNITTTLKKKLLMLNYYHSPSRKHSIKMVHG